MTENLIEKVHILYNQGRYNDAERIIVSLMNQNPDNEFLLYYLSEIQYQKGSYVKAEELIDQAIAKNPESGNYFYLKSRLQLTKEKINEAEKHIQEAIRLEPFNADYFAYLAQLQLYKKQYESALATADKALALDANNVFALNLRSTSLLKLNRKEESFATISEALHENPNNAYTHANHGWGLLEKGDNNAALEHFKESLKNDPESEYAKLGMVEALKAKFAVYRWYIKYVFWIGNMAPKFQWFFILGFYFGSKLLQNLARKNEILAPFIYPIVFLLFVFAFSTWILSPVGNLYLLLNKYGKHLLGKEEKVTATSTGFCILLSVISAISYYITGNFGFAILGIFSFTMMIPISNIYSKPRKLFITYTILMFITGAIATYLSFATDIAFSMFTMIYAFGLLGFQFIANYFTTKIS